MFLVRYYDSRLSSAGRGVQRRVFWDRQAAQEFAEGRKLYARPARVEEIGPVKVPE